MVWNKIMIKAFEYFVEAAGLGCIHAFFALGTLFMQRGEIEEAMFNYRKADILPVERRRNVNKTHS